MRGSNAGGAEAKRAGLFILEGTVDSQQDKDAATLYAKSVPNVFSVENYLVVKGSK